MRFRGIYMLHYFTACLSAALPSKGQDDADPTEAQSTSLAACMKKLEVDLSVDSIKNNVRKLDKCNKESLENFVAFIFDDLPHAIDIKQFRDGCYMGTNFTTVVERHKTRNDFFIEKFNKAITYINDMQSRMKRTIDRLGNSSLTIVNKACDAFIFNLAQNTINPKYLFLHPLQKFIDSRSNDYDALYAKIESNQNQLEDVICNRKERIADLDYCSQLGYVAEVFIKNYCRYHAYYKQMDECMERYRSLLYSLEDEFETLVPEDSGFLSEFQIMKVCFSRKHCGMVLAIYNEFQDNQKCIEDVIHEYNITSMEKWKKNINLDRQCPGWYLSY